MTIILLLLALLFGPPASIPNSGRGSVVRPMDSTDPSGGSGGSGGCIVQQGCGTGG
jgi:hypothetical protein